MALDKCVKQVGVVGRDISGYSFALKQNREGMAVPPCLWVEMMGERCEMNPPWAKINNQWLPEPVRYRIPLRVGQI